MAEFFTGQHLNSAIEGIIEDAFEELIFVSPYIKIHPHLRDRLLEKKDNPDLCIMILFGKNKDALHMSFPEDQFSFFKQFKYVIIKYQERLHAKYYANERAGILSSMNLYDYSLNNNIEFGVLVKKALLVGTSGRLEREAKIFFDDIFHNATTLYAKEPQFDKNMLGVGKYRESIVKIDKLTSIYEQSAKQHSSQSPIHINGYCIRTGCEIPFNVNRPLSDDAFSSWNKFKNPTYPEKYCHFSGETAETCYEKPILAKNWQFAKQYL